METTHPPTRTTRWIKTGVAAGALGLVSLTGAFALGPATAESGSDGTAATVTAGDTPNDLADGWVSQLTAEQKDCLKAANLTRPEGRPTAAERRKFRKVAKGCGIEIPDHPRRDRVRHFLAKLTDEQKDCLKDAELSWPDGRPTPEQREAFRAAAENCGIDLPDHPERPELTDEQRQCLENDGLTRPEGRPTAEQIAKLRAAAEKCGIDLPDHSRRPA